MGDVLVGTRGALRRDQLVGVAVALGVYLALTVVVVRALALPAHVESLQVQNPHRWSAHVEVTDSHHDGWVGLGTVDRQTTRDFAEVLDMGDQWTLRFAYSSTAVELTVTRDELAADGWRLTVPDAFAAGLRSRGVPETPRH